MYLIGADEAGYAPRLGPLVISAAVWHVPGTRPRLDTLPARLAGAIATGRPKSPAADGPLVIADSKAIYSPTLGLGLLERGVLAALGIIRHLPQTWREAWDLLAPDACDHLDAQPWYDGFDVPLPASPSAGDLHAALSRLSGHLARCGVRWVALRSRVVFPEEFNRAAVAAGNKAEALSAWTLHLVGQLLADLPPDDAVCIVCDKHGGRNHYLPHLQRQFPDHFIEVRRESAEESRYRWGPPQRRVECCFKTRGESFLPTALASMTSKYLRELSMLAFNAFWQRHIPELRPTAGYPTDARRFKDAITQVQQRLGIADALLWRTR